MKLRTSPFSTSLAAMVLLITAVACERHDASPGAAPFETSTGAAVWQPLFDGETLRGWRGFQAQGVPEGWTVTPQNEIHFSKTDVDYDFGLMTEQQFDDFELAFEWRVVPGGNSGVFFRVVEDGHAAIWETGPEYQVVDNVGHADGQDPVTSAGSNYGLHGPDEDFARPAGEYNEGRIVALGDRVEHWLNGQRVVEYELGSPDWQQRVSDTKFSELPAYGVAARGHIALQEGGPVWFRNIRIRSIPSAD
jgi:hypothetical protein